MVELGETYNFSTITRFLETCEKQNYLLSYILFSKKLNTPLKKLFPSVNPASYTKIALCDDHDDDFSWCPKCGEADRSDEEYF